LEVKKSVEYKSQTKDQKPKTKDQSSVAAILLAAGRSERMGAFKALLPFGNKTVIESCIDYLQASGIDTVVAVVGRGRDQLRDKLLTKSILTVENPDPESEMGHSIACGIKALPDSIEAAVIALVDHPAVSPQVVNQLIGEWRKGAQLIVPTWQGVGGHPVLVDLRFRAELLQLPVEGGLKSLFRKHGGAVRRLPVDSPFIARDMDTWDDYTRLYWDVFGEQPPIRGESNESPPPTI
jgi:molybdenum cofactor cytidylyltransferase